jgi:hypothetical protein
VNNSFVLLTAAKNEAMHIGHCIESVLRQTRLPSKWIIVDDGSTDTTAAIVSAYSAKHPFITLHSNCNRGKRSFGAQYRAINTAYTLLREMAFDFVAIQDADIVLPEADYFKAVLNAFEIDPKLGIAGGYIYEASGSRWLPRKSNSPDSVAGAVQVFRRLCYEQVGGYHPLLYGGEDWLAQIEAKRAGWKVASLTNLRVHHHRPTSSAGGRLRGVFRLGLRDASFGSSPTFEFLKCARRVTEPPVIVSAVVRAAGYLYYRLARNEPLLTDDQVAYLRAEQIGRIRRMVTRRAELSSTQP